MRKPPFLVILLIAVQTQAQVLDVNGDNEVGAEEAIAVAEQWKGQAIARNDHNHLGQTWTGNRNPLTIQGNFPPRIVIGPAKPNQKGFSASPSAPLILDNTANPTNGYPSPDLILRGSTGMISAEDSGSSLDLVSNGNVWLWLDSDNDSPFSTFSVINGERAPILGIFEDGDMAITGNLETAGGTLKIDHPLDPANKYLTHSAVESSEMKNVYDGVVYLDDRGEAVVVLPFYFEAFNTDCRYQLTPIGSPAPNLYVAEKIKDNRFKIAGGSPGLEVSWMVTGVRRDAYAKANPIKVERDKSDEEKGKYLHPEVFGESVEKGVGLIQRSLGE